jgi:hypothetical protein
MDVLPTKPMQFSNFTIQFHQKSNYLGFVHFSVLIFFVINMCGKSVHFIRTIKSLNLWFWLYPLSKHSFLITVKSFGSAVALWKQKQADSHTMPPCQLHGFPYIKSLDVTKSD